MAWTLLLADDSVSMQRVVELMFANEDIAVVAVSDGGEAIARIDANPPDIVLADIGMRGRSGYEVAQHVKESRRLAGIPVILLTGAFEPVDHARATAMGCDAVLAKPFESQLVIDLVKGLLEKAGDAPRAAELTRLDTYFEALDSALASLPDVPLAERPSGAAHMVPPVPVRASFPLAGAFATLLGSTEQQPRESEAAWLVQPRGGPPEEELIEAVTRRVLDRLSRSPMRERVHDIVSTMAERLLREEIERIKSSIT